MELDSLTEGNRGVAKSSLVRDAACRAAAYFMTADQRGVFPTAEARARLERFGAELPAGPTPAGVVIAQLDELGSPATVVSTHGRYFGFVTGGTDSTALAATVLSSAWDQNIATPTMSPVAAHLDRLTARWVCELTGLPEGATATFCAGASMANLTCILAARDALLQRAGWDSDRRGLGQAPALRVVASAEIHVSVLKALRAAGIGSDSITFAPTDATGSVNAAEFPRVDDRTIVLLQAGNVNTGHSDPFAKLIARAHAGGAWVHVDGAFGLWAAASPTRRPLVAGMQKADSWATDAHKWLNAPYDSGIAICAREQDLRRAFAVDAPYLTTDADRALMHLGLAMSQRARAIETWAIIAAQGRTGIAAIVDRACDHAAHFARLLSSAGATVLAPVVLNQALVQFDDDSTTDAVIAGVQRDGTCWAGGTSWHGRRAMRLSVSDTATTSADIERSADAIIGCWRTVRRALAR